MNKSDGMGVVGKKGGLLIRLPISVIQRLLNEEEFPLIKKLGKVFGKK